MAELSVSKQSIRKVLDTDVKYIIPDYQRPYRWDKEKCETLWEDITSFFEENKNTKEEYYLGTLVFCDGESENENEIIDGQQRITSFVLMLRAFYKKLEQMDRDAEVAGLMGQIEPCIWEVDPMTRSASDKTKIRLVSRVITAIDNDILHRLVEDGEMTENKSTYQKNFQYFYEKCDEYASQNPMQWKTLCLFILERCIVLPIECKDFNTALTIFNTLNDRGMPLLDSDIFKARIYKKQQSDHEKAAFVKEWKELEEIAGDSGIRVDSLFRYYTHYIRGCEGNTKKEIKLREFYTGKSNERLYEPNLIPNLIELADFWREILSSDPKRYINVTGGQYVHCLYHYPNEYWRYVLSTFFILNKENKDSPEFRQKMDGFLSELAAFFYAKFIIIPNVNGVKSDVYRKCKNLCDGTNDSLRVEGYSVGKMRERMAQDLSSRAEKGLLLLYAYMHPEQEGYIPDGFEIEHILPQKWQKSNYRGWDEATAKEFMDDIGNKMVIGKKTNIVAGNEYFGQKKAEYRKSKIAEVKALAQHPNDDWTPDDIRERRERVINGILEFFAKNGVIAK